MLNVRDSQGTLILTKSTPTGGTALTIKKAVELDKSYLVVDLDKDCNLEIVKKWLVDSCIDTLNVAGPRESNFPAFMSRQQYF